MDTKRVKYHYEARPDRAIALLLLVCALFELGMWRALSGWFS